MQVVSLANWLSSRLCSPERGLGTLLSAAPGIFVKMQSPGSHLRFNKLPEDSKAYYSLKILLEL